MSDSDSDLVDYNSDNHTKNHTEITIQISNGIIILIPVISLFFVNKLEFFKKSTVFILLFVMMAGIFSTLYHRYEHHHDTIPNLFLHLDIISSAAIIILSFFVMFDIIMTKKDAGGNKINRLNSVRMLFRVLYLFIVLLMISLYVFSFVKKDGSHKDIVNRKQLYHTCWHLCAAMCGIIIVLYIFGKNQKINIMNSDSR